MRILFCDLLFEFGNRHVDNSMIELMTKQHKVYLLMNDDFMKGEFSNNNLIVLGNKYDNKTKGAISNATQILRRMRLAAKYARELKPDVVYISTYETRTFPIGLFFFDKTSNIVVLENYNIDFLRYRSHKIAYKLFANRVHHMVYESYFGDYLVNSIGVKPELVHTVPHFYYPPYVNSLSYKDEGKRYDFVGLSGSNDQDVIGEIVEIESKEHFFENNRIRCYIKSSIHHYESDYLTVSNRFLSTEEYNALYCDSRAVLVLFPTSYIYRMSGCIVDAFSNHKQVISTNLELSKFYHSKYGSIILPCESSRDVLNQVKTVMNAIQRNLDFSGFEKDHSNETIEKCLSTMLNCVKS